MSESKPLGGKVLTGPFLFFSIFAILGGIFLVKRFMYGIGSVSNLSHGYPWGIWIAYDVVVGTAFACGGYAMALLVYAMNKGEYHPLVRPALMASMFGYTLAGVSVFFDIGRYWNIFNVFLPKYTNFNSVMLEVALCVAAYITVLWIEFSPVFVEKMKADNIKYWLNKILIFFIALGILLPTMHQSSLGTMMILAGKKLSPLWWSPLLPLLFLISAVFIGYGVVIFESVLSAQGFNKPQETPILAKLSTIIPRFIAVYLAIRFGDLIARGQLGLAFAGDMNSIMFIIENIFYLLPLFILSSKENRTSPRMLFIASVSLMLGGALYRLNAYIIGFNPGPGWHYFPSVAELLITFGIISIEIMAYLWFVRKLPVLPTHEHA